MMRIFGYLRRIVYSQYALSEPSGPTAEGLSSRLLYLRFDVAACSLNPIFLDYAARALLDLSAHGVAEFMTEHALIWMLADACKTLLLNLCRNHVFLARHLMSLQKYHKINNAVDFPQVMVCTGCHLSRAFSRHIFLLIVVVLD